MKTLLIDDLVFAAHSPSCYELLSVRDDVGADARVYVRFDGKSWGIHYHAASTNIWRPFASREAAIAMLAQRRAA